MNSSLWPRLPFILPQASSTAESSDAVFLAIHLIALFFAVGIFACLIFFTVRYRRGSKVNRALPEHEGIALELTWTIIPMIILMMLFVWSTSAYFTMIRVPAGAMEVNVVGKQWMWKIEQPNGRWEMNELHVPIGRAVKLNMISEDVIHDFGIPAFRIKQDVIPGRYTTMWFEPTRVGRYRIFCSQYCGTNHSIMTGFIDVMDQGEYDKWLSTGNLRGTSASNGERLFREYGCTGCHGYDANVRAPSLEGIYGKPRPIQVPSEGNRTKVIIADYRYIHDSILLPDQEVAAGFKPIMPTFKGQLSEQEVLQLIDYIKSLGTSNGTSNGNAKAYTSAGNGPDEARTGNTSVPSNSDLYNMVDRDRAYDQADHSAAQAHADLYNMVDRDKIQGDVSAPRSYNERGTLGNPANHHNYRTEDSETADIAKTYSGVGSSKISKNYTRANNNNITRMPAPTYPLNANGSPATPNANGGATGANGANGKNRVKTKGNPNAGERTSR